MKLPVSDGCGKSELDLFTLPPTQVDVESGEYHMVPPLSNFESGTVVFKIPGDSQNYIDLSETQLCATLKVVKADGSEMKKEDWIGVFPVNNLLHSIFSQIQVTINHTTVENSNSTYAYRAYLENLLCYRKDAKETFLLNELYNQDEVSNFESLVDEANGVNKNLGAQNRRQQFTLQKNRVELRGRLHSDILNMNRYLLPQCEVQISLTRSKNSFALMSNKG